MSHVVGVQMEGCKDLRTLRAAVEAAGGVWHENQTTHEWYGRFVNDWSGSRSAATQGRNPATFGKCLHAISVPGIRYEIGVVEHASGEGYDLVYDNFGSSGRHDGNRLEAHFGGIGLPAIKQGYSVEATKRELSRKGYRLTTVRQADGTVRVKAIR